MLDRLPRIWRHLLIQTIAVLLAWAGSDLVPWLRDRPDGWAALAGVILGQLLLVVTPLVRYLDPDATAGRHEDAGTSRAAFAALVGFALAAALVVATLLAGPADAHRRPAEHVRTNGAQVCGGTLLVAFELEQLVGGAWTFRQDDGAAVVQLHHLGNGAAPGGQWETYVPASGGEGHLRLSVVGRPFWDAVRVVHDGIASSPRLPVECAA